MRLNGLTLLLLVLNVAALGFVGVRTAALGQHDAS